MSIFNEDSWLRWLFLSLVSAGAWLQGLDAQLWTTYTRGRGTSHHVQAVYQSVDGAMWFGTKGGASRYDGTSWQTFTQADGLGGNDVRALYQSADGAMWFGTNEGGSRWSEGGLWGMNWQIFTRVDGLGGNDVRAVYQSMDGAMWFGAKGGGVSWYDGSSWQTFARAERPPPILRPPQSSERSSPQKRSPFPPDPISRWPNH